MKKTNLSKLYHTSNIRKQDFFEENGLRPVRYEGDLAYYKRNKQLLSLLESYEIRTIFFENQKRK